MKKIFFLVFSIAILNSCTSNEDSNNIITNTFKVRLTDNTPEMNEIYTIEYLIDDEGKVLKETILDNLYPALNSISIFKYDSQNRLIKEIRNDQLINFIEWNGNTAILYNYQGNFSGNLLFSNNNLIQSECNGITINYNYDINDNIISFEENNIVKEEYLDYDLNYENPMYLINSIRLFRLSPSQSSKYFYQTKKVLPFIDGDSEFPLTYYNYQKTLNSDNKIIKINGDIYIHHFEYN